MNQKSYAEARKELVAIMKELESPALDVDVLDIKVARAASLIRFCRQRIYQVRLKVDKVVLDLEQELDSNKKTELGESDDAEEIPF